MFGTVRLDFIALGFACFIAGGLAVGLSQRHYRIEDFNPTCAEFKDGKWIVIPSSSVVK